MKRIVRAAGAVGILLQIIAFAAAFPVFAQEKLPPDDPQFQAIMKEAIAIAEKGNQAEALPLFQKALQHAEQANAPLDEARALYNIGLVYYNQKKIPEAIEHLSRALTLRHDNKLPAGSGDTQLLLGLAHEEQGDTAHMKEYLLQAIPLLSVERKGAYLGKLALQAYHDGDRDAALEYLSQGIEAHRAANKIGGEANLLSLRHIMEVESGQHEKSLATNRQILALLEAVKEAKEVDFPLFERKAMTLNGIGTDLKELGRSSEAFLAFENARDFAHEHALTAQEAIATTQIGRIFETSDPSRALNYFRKVAAIWKAANEPIKEAEALEYVAFTEERIPGTSFQAEDDLRAAIDAAERSKDPDMIAMAEERLAIALRYKSAEAKDQKQSAVILAEAIGHYESAKKHWINRLATTKIRDAGDEDHVLLQYSGLLFSLSIAYRQAHRLQDVAEQLAQAEALAARSGLKPDIHQFSLEIAGNIAENILHNHAKALAHFKEALLITETIHDEQSRAEFLTSIGKIEEATGDRDTALNNYLRAIRLWEGLKDKTQSSELETGVHVTAADSYGAAVMLLMRMGKTQEAFNMAEQSRVQQFIQHMDEGPQVFSTEVNANKKQLNELDIQISKREQQIQSTIINSTEYLQAEDELTSLRIKLGELSLRNKVIEKCTNAAREMPTTLAELRPYLDARTTLVSYFVTNERTLAFVVTRHTFKSYELTAGSSEMEELVQKLWGREGKQSSANLYRSLITPLLPDLQTPLVALLPTGLLNQVSFAMLSEDGQHYFGDEHTLYYLPNAAALSIPPGTLPRLPVMLSVSNPNAGTHLAELKATEPEATQVAEIYGTQAIHGITESEFRAKAPLADLIHVAAHAEVVPSNPAFSRIYLKQDEQNDGNLQINEIEKLDLRRVDLVTLSACSTAAQASLGANDDFQSINRAFLDAGVRSVIATLWQVSDNTASILMPSFYQHLREGKSKAVALQLAQQEARALHPNQQSNDWAAFILTGQPGVEQ